MIGENRRAKGTTTRAKVVRNAILSLIALFSFLIFSFFVFSFFFPKFRSQFLSFWIFIALFLLSSALVIRFLKIKIERPSKELEKPDLTRIRIWWISIKHSHHASDLIEDEIKIGKRNVCSGCYGTALGFILGEISCLQYFLVYNLQMFFNLQIELLGLILFLSGMGLVSLTFIKFIKPINGITRLIFNAGIPLGTWFILVGVDSIFKNGFVLLYFLIFIPFLFYQRLRLSESDHQTRRAPNLPEIPIPHGTLV